MEKTAGRIIGGAGQRQVQLPLNKAVKIAMQSIRVRFWRSMITAAGVFLGIAFLASTLANSTIGAHTKQDNTGLDPAQQSQIVQGQHDRQIWLVTLSLVVCTVGIANSMLMSVTERFKEIGTMKCLGALDGFIIKLFFIESCLLGFLASALGCVAGILAISLLHMITDGLSAFGSAFFNGAIQLAGFAIVIGTVLTFSATMIPALRAAKIPPAAALRVEI